MDHSLTLLVDASSLIYRAFFSNPDTVRSPDGRLVNAAHGFLGMLARLVSDRNPDLICCAADEDWRPDWRVQLIDSYKTHRAADGSPQQLVEDQLEAQIPIIFELLALCGVAVVGHTDYEAEDVIGTLAARAPGPVEIVSGDRDLFQLVRDPRVVVLYPRRGVSVMDRVDEAYIQEKYGIPGTAYGDYAILRGDPSDGLPGVRGIGEKHASALLARYGSLDSIIEAAVSGGGITLGKVRGSLEYIERAKRVTTIPTDLDLVEVDLERPRGKPDDRIYAISEYHGLAGPVRRLVEALRSE